MLDTVVLTVDSHNFLIRDHDVFTPSSKGLFFEPYYPIKKGGVRCKYNPTKAEEIKYGYMPKLTLYKP